jgi:hypothetical protein
MRKLIEYRQQKGLHHKLMKVAEHSRLGIDAIVMLYHCAKISAGDILEAGETKTSVGPISGTGRSAFKQELKLISLFSGAIYFLSAAPGAGEDADCAGKSELNASIPTFHFPSAFFCHTSQYLPLSLLPSVIVIS